MWRAYAGVIHFVFGQILNLQNKTKTWGKGGPQTDKPPAAKYIYWSIFKKSRQLGFGVFIDIWSMGRGKETFRGAQKAGPLIEAGRR